MTVSIVTAIYGGYDAPKPIASQSIPTTNVLVTDAEVDAPGWNVSRQDYMVESPRYAAKIPKCIPSYATDADITIWVDGHIEIVSPDFAAWCVARLGDADIALVPHPHRTSILDEAKFSTRLAKYQGQPMIQQAMQYIGAGFSDTRLYELGVIVRRASEVCSELGSAWLFEQHKWTLQDQISLPPIIEHFEAERGLTVATLPIRMLSNEFYRLHRHRDGTI